jgi:hypothetical protein
LSSNNYGFLFEDSSKMIISEDLHQFYYLRKEFKNGKNQFKAGLHTFKDLPYQLKSKMRIIQNGMLKLAGRDL